MANLGVTPEYLRSTYLAALVPRIEMLQGRGSDAPLAEAIEDAAASLQQELSTRFERTKFIPYSGNDEPPALGANEEYVGYSQWPGSVPGDGFTRLRPKIRPVISIDSVKVNMPGAILRVLEIPSDWLRVDRSTNEVIITPNAGSALFSLMYAQGGLGWRTPHSVIMEFTAGLESDNIAYPRVKRLLAIRATVALLPLLSAWVNPTGLTSESADGLSQSRSSGYVFSDLEKRLTEEADGLKRAIIDAWDGPSFIVL